MLPTLTAERGEGYYGKKILRGNPELPPEVYVACFPGRVEVQGLAAS